jgi:hypothetical protein
MASSAPLLMRLYDASRVQTSAQAAVVIEGVGLAAHAHINRHPMKEQAPLTMSRPRLIRILLALASALLTPLPERAEECLCRAVPLSSL